MDPTAFGAANPEEWEDRYVPGILDGLKHDGNIYGVICEASAPVLFYNKAHFLEAGLDPDAPPKTWDELIEMGKKLVKYDENGRMIRKAFDIVYLHAQWYMNRLQTFLARRAVEFWTRPTPSRSSTRRNRSQRCSCGMTSFTSITLRIRQSDKGLHRSGQGLCRWNSLHGWVTSGLLS